MSIKIKQHNNNWRIIIEQEELEFKSRKEMELELKNILDIKEIYGQIKGDRL